MTWHATDLTSNERIGATGGLGATIWLTGLPASGKSTIAHRAERLLVNSGRAAYTLDGDNVRHGLNADLGFSATDRIENVRRIGEVALLMADAGLVVLASLISPYRSSRDAVRRLHDSAGFAFYEVFVDTPLSVCEERDPKGLYARTRAGAITGVTGIDDPYDRPRNPDLVLHDGSGTIEVRAERVIGLLHNGT